MQVLLVAAERLRAANEDVPEPDVDGVPVGRKAS